MGDLVSGAVVGALFAELFADVKEAVKTTIRFRSRLESLESTLQYIKPIIKEIDSLNKLLDDPEEEMKGLHDLMKNGKILVAKSSRVNMNIWKRYRYSTKLADFEDNIVKFFQIYIIVISRDNKKVLMEVKDIHLAVRKLSLMLEGGWSNKGMKSGALGGFESCVVPKAPEFVVGLSASVRQLKKWLLDGGVSVKVVSAPGGCGKTTLVETLCHDSEIKGKFRNNIFFVTVSRSPNFTVLVQKMIHHKGKDVPQIETDEYAIDQLQQLLEEIGKVPVLLVLDDVWSESESLLEKFWFNKIQDYKILVTSRSELSSFGTLHKLNRLNHEDARKLFLHSATPRASSSFGPRGSSLRSHSSIGMAGGSMLPSSFGPRGSSLRSHSSIGMAGGSMLPREELIDEIVNRCKGSPLALTLVGKSFCGKNPQVWESELLKWSEGQFVDLNSAIFDCLRKSLDDLDGMPLYKECFMDLGSFPEDHAVPATALIDMWIELHGLDVDGVHAKRVLHELAARNLVDLVATKNDESEGDGFYNDLYVRQHDLLRELAIHQSSQGPIQERKRLNLDVRGNKFPSWLSIKEEQTPSARLLSISTDENFSSDWPRLELPAVEVLVLNFCTREYTLPPFIETMVSLKALIITNHGFFPAEISNLTILGSLLCLRRIRLERIKIPSFAPSITISSLQKASFSMCDLRDLMTMPNLTELDISYCSELNSFPSGLCDVTSLRKVVITSCHNLSALPDQIGNLINLQVLRLSSCLNLSDLPESIGMLQKLAFLDISNCFSINKLPDEIGRLHGLKELHMKGCSDLAAVPEAVINLEQLRYVFCDQQRARLWSSYERRLPKMKLRIVQEDINLNWLLISS